jgi:hypothetical protein
VPAARAASLCSEPFMPPPSQGRRRRRNASPKISRSVPPEARAGVHLAERAGASVDRPDLARIELCVAFTAARIAARETRDGVQVDRLERIFDLAQGCIRHAVSGIAVARTTAQAASAQHDRHRARPPRSEVA